MIETGKVIEVENGNAKVYVARHAACGDCGSCQIGRDNLNMILTAENKIGAEVGDFVEIELLTENFLFASFILYGIPLIALILGISVGYYSFIALGYQDGTAQLLAALSGIILLALSFLSIKNKESKIKEMKRFKPTLSKIVEKDL